MLRSVVSFETLLGTNFKDAALGKYLKAIERATGLEFVADSRQAEFTEPGLQDLVPIVKSLKDSGVLQSLHQQTGRYADEPRIFQWSAAYTKDDFAGGSSLLSNHQALIATLAECLERHLWSQATDYLRDPIVSSDSALNAPHVAVSRFAAFTGEQRATLSRLHITPQSEFTWVKARSLISDSDVYVPEQVITSRRSARTLGRVEPMIRPAITTGLATGVSRVNALVGGALEIIERDAFMIMWLNQLSCPRVDLAELSKNNDTLTRLLQIVSRYRLSVEVALLVTDAPAHVVCAVVRDETGVGPARILGLGAEADLGNAAAHAISEGLRIRWSARRHMDNGVDFGKIVPQEIMHSEHMLYWLHGDRYKRLDFMTSGPIQKYAPAPWEKDTPEEHLERIVEWCRAQGYELASVDMGSSKKNATPLAVEMVVIPELQPMHLIERHQCLGGRRISDVPRKSGYTPLTFPFSAEPHPFV